MIDWTVKIGDLLVIFSFISAIGYHVFKAGKLARSIEAIQQEIVDLKEVARAVSGVLTSIAVQATRMTMMEKHIDEMRHGRGFIKTEKP